MSGSVALVVLAVQSTALAMFMKYSRASTSYIPGSLVCTVELVKLLCCFGLEAWSQRSFRRAVTLIRRDLSMNGREVCKLAVPALLYALQNNLCYLALSHLSVLNFQIIQQLKILTTAAFSVWLLRKPLTRQHWLALVLLCAGVATVQVSSGSSHADGGGSNAWLGVGALLFNSVSSGYAGVYFEQQAKRKDKRAKHRSIWVQSVELGLFGLLFSLLLALLGSDGAAIARMGFFHGYGNRMVLATVALQSLGGLLVAMVIRHADNIQKAFATSLSIVLSSLVSSGLLGHALPPGLVAGSAMVCAAVCLYAAASSGL